MIVKDRRHSSVEETEMVSRKGLVMIFILIMTMNKDYRMMTK